MYPEHNVLPIYLSSGVFRFIINKLLGKTFRCCGRYSMAEVILTLNIPEEGYSRNVS